MVRLSFQYLSKRRLTATGFTCIFPTDLIEDVAQNLSAVAPSFGIVVCPVRVLLTARRTGPVCVVVRTAVAQLVAVILDVLC